MRRLQGTIVSHKMKNTVVVLVERLKKHSKYLKFYRVSKRFKAHEESGSYRVGDVVMIEETRPLSKEKRWKVVSLVKRAPEEEVIPEGGEGEPTP